MKAKEFILRALVLFFIGNIIFIGVLMIVEIVGVLLLSSNTPHYIQILLYDFKRFEVIYVIVFLIFYTLDYLYKRYLVEGLNQNLNEMRKKK